MKGMNLIYEIKKLENLGFHSKWQIIEEKERKIVLTDVFEAHIIEIPKIYKAQNDSNNKLVV